MFSEDLKPSRSFRSLDPGQQVEPGVQSKPGGATFSGFCCTELEQNLQKISNLSIDRIDVAKHSSSKCCTDFYFVCFMRIKNSRFPLAPIPGGTIVTRFGFSDHFIVRLGSCCSVQSDLWTPARWLVTGQDF